MSLGRRRFLTACLVVILAAEVRTAEAGPFMERIVDSVFATAEKEFFGGPPPVARNSRSGADRYETPSTSGGSRAVQPNSYNRRPTAGWPRLLRRR